MILKLTLQNDWNKSWYIFLLLLIVVGGSLKNDRFQLSMRKWLMLHICKNWFSSTSLWISFLYCNENNDTILDSRAVLSLFFGYITRGVHVRCMFEGMSTACLFSLIDGAPIFQPHLETTYVTGKLFVDLNIVFIINDYPRVGGGTPFHQECRFWV